MKIAHRSQLTALWKNLEAVSSDLLAVWRSQTGAIGLIGILLYSSAILVVGSTMVVTSVTNYKISNQRISSVQSLYHAESGAEDALRRIRIDANYGSSPVDVITSFDTKNWVETRVEALTAAGCAVARQVTASGITPESQRNVRLTNCGVPNLPQVSFAYALQAGAGGINMNNNSTVNGTTYSNGNHTAGNGARVTGSAWVAGGAAPAATPNYDPAGTTDRHIGNSANSSAIDGAQSFIADTSGSSTLVKVQLKVKKFGNPSNATVRIVTDNANKPSGTQLASGTLNAATVGSSASFIDVSMTSPPTLTNGTRYWVVIDAASSSSNYWGWAEANGYANGKGMTSDRWRSSGSMTWTDTNSDFAFKTFMGAPPTFISGLIVGQDIHANTINNNTVASNAYFQTNNGSSIGGASFPGSTDPPQADFPISDANVDDFKADAASGVTYTGDYLVENGETATIGPIKIDGDLIVENNTTINITGTVWVTGNISLSNNTTVSLAGYPAGESAAMVADGTINVSNNVLIDERDNNYLMLLSTSTSSTAVNLSNNADGIVLVAQKGTMVINNNAVANALVAYRLQMENNAVVNYLEGLADTRFYGGPGGGFLAKGWKEVLCDDADPPNCS